MGKVIKNALLGLLVVVFIFFAGFMMNKSTKLLEHWAYPTDYSEIVEQKSEEYGVPLSVIYAVIRTESGFDPEAESWVGARGTYADHERRFRMDRLLPGRNRSNLGRYVRSGI